MFDAAYLRRINGRLVTHRWANRTSNPLRTLCGRTKPRLAAWSDHNTTCEKCLSILNKLDNLKGE